MCYEKCKNHVLKCVGSYFVCKYTVQALVVESLNSIFLRFNFLQFLPIHLDLFSWKKNFL